MPKKPPKNGYFYFMRDFKIREEKLGRRFPGGMKDVADAASYEWQCMPQHEKDEYNRRAKDERHFEDRENVSRSLEKKFNSLGISFAAIEREKQEKARKAEEIKKFVADFVKGLDKSK